MFLRRILFFLLLLITATCKARRDSSILTSAENPYDLVTRCENGMAPYWGQEAMDADLMQYYLDKKQINDRVRVAVVDSGLDAKSIPDFDKRNTISSEAGVKEGDIHPTHVPEYKVPHITLPGYKHIGDLDRDQSGHGTGVSSLIVGGGQQGVAKDVDFTFYRVTGPGARGSTSSEFLEIATHKACLKVEDPDGVGIINVSWGGRLDEVGLDQDEKSKFYKKMLQIFAEKGCLVTKAAGNDNFRAARDYNLDDPYLRVQSTDYLNDLSFFSTTGEVSAPGSDIQIYQSHQAAAPTNKKSLCSKDSQKPEGFRRFVNGTSFAAPLAAGIASQVVKVLKHFHGFDGLNNPDRIKLVNRILSVSHVAGVLNGLRAVRIAELMSLDSNHDLRTKLLSFDPKNPNFKVPLDDDSVCKEQTRECVSKSGDELLTCVNFERTKVNLCSTASADDYIQIAKASSKNSALEKAYHYTRQFEARFGKTEQEKIQALRKDLLKDYLARNTKSERFLGSRGQYKDYIQDVDTSFLRDVMVPYWKSLKQIPPEDKKTIADLWGVIFTSFSIRDALSYGIDPVSGEDRGSNAIVASIREFAELTLSLGMGSVIEKELANRMNALQDETKFNLKLVSEGSSSERIGDISAIVRLLNMFAEVPNFSRSALSSADQNTLTQLRRLNTYYAYSTEKVPLLFEVYPTRSTFFTYLSRDTVFSAVRNTVLSNVTQASPVEVHFARQNPEKFGLTSSDAKERFYWSLANAIFAGQGWGSRNDGELLEDILLFFKDKGADSPQYQTWLQLLKQGQNIGAFSVLAGRIGKKVPFGLDMDDMFVTEIYQFWIDYYKKFSYNKHPWGQRDVRLLLASKLLTVFPGAYNDDLTKSTVLSNDFASGIKGILGELLDFQGDFTFSRFIMTPGYPDRLKSPELAGPMVHAKDFNLTFAFDQYFTGPMSIGGRSRLSGIFSKICQDLGGFIGSNINSKIRRALPSHPYPPYWMAAYDRWKAETKKRNDVVYDTYCEGYLKNLRIVHKLDPDVTGLYNGPALDY
jgi:hypothetical protein